MFTVLMRFISRNGILCCLLEVTVTSCVFMCVCVCVCNGCMCISTISRYCYCSEPLMCSNTCLRAHMYMFFFFLVADIMTNMLAHIFACTLMYCTHTCTVAL